MSKKITLYVPDKENISTLSETVNLEPETDLFTPSFTLRTECERGVNHPVKTAKFTGKQEIKNFTLEELKFQNFDVTLEEKHIKSYPETEQLNYYRDVCKQLKKELLSVSKNWMEMYKDNLKCGRTIETLKALNHGLEQELNKTKAEYKELEKYQNELLKKWSVKRKVRQMAHSYLREKELEEHKQTNKVYKKELQAKQKSPVTDAMLTKMINMRNAGKKYADIASTLNISTATVSKHLKRNQDRLTEFNI